MNTVTQSDAEDFVHSLIADKTMTLKELIERTTFIYHEFDTTTYIPELKLLVTENEYVCVDRYPLIWEKPWSMFFDYVLIEMYDRDTKLTGGRYRSFPERRFVVRRLIFTKKFKIFSEN